MKKKVKDEDYMRLALRQAERARLRGEVPVGAVVVFGDRVVGRGANGPIGRNDPTAHAEIVAIRRAAKETGNYRLTGCDLFVTLEPCAMCVGAIVQARIRRLVYGAADPKSGSVRSVLSFPFDRVNHRPDIVSGILEEECAAILTGFFRGRRRLPE